VRRLGLNLLTLGVTMLVLISLGFAAKSTFDAAEDSRRPAANVSTSVRAFGIYVDPWHVDEWARAVGAQPTMVAKFEAFSRRRTIDDFIDEAERQGIRKLLVSWEPWKPVPASLGVVAQARPQPGFRNRDIAAGAQDSYIRAFARSLATFDGTVFLRYAHEMNGFWYPWKRDPAAYRSSWRHVVTLVREHAGNVRFVWSANPNLYLQFDRWDRRLRPYWPGRGWVDYVGSTMINFGGRKHYTIERFAPRLRRLRATYRKPLVLTEVNTNYAGRVQWLRGLRRMLTRMPWIRSLAWSQLPSRGQVHMKHVGELNWDVQRDPPSAHVIREIIRDGRGLRGRGALRPASQQPRDSAPVP
jgi:mannan endo-1,4-beta-mannosidase